DEDLAAGRLEKPHRGLEEGRLARSVRAEDRHDLARPERRTDTAQDRSTRVARAGASKLEARRDRTSSRRPLTALGAGAAVRRGRRRGGSRVRVDLASREGRVGAEALEDDLEGELDRVRVGDP